MYTYDSCSLPRIPLTIERGKTPKKIMASPNPVPSAYSNLRIRGSGIYESWIYQRSATSFVFCVLLNFFLLDWVRKCNICTICPLTLQILQNLHANQSAKVFWANFCTSSAATHRWSEEPWACSRIIWLHC